MADTIRSRAALLALFADNTAGDISAQDQRDFTVSAYEPQMTIPGGRLTLTTGVPVTTTDVTGATNVYYTPYLHNGIGLYDGTSWTLFTFSEITFALGTLSNNTNYDVFLYDNSGTLTLEAAAWTNDTTRATALTLQDGVYVKSGATTRRYLGTFRTTATTTTEDSATKRFLWNAYNREMRKCLVTDSTSSWTLGSSSAWSQRGSKQFAAVFGLAGPEVNLLLSVLSSAGSAGASSAGVAIGRDSTSTPSGTCGQTNYTNSTFAAFGTEETVGYHYYSWLENATVATATFYGALTSPTRTSGMTGWMQG